MVIKSNDRLWMILILVLLILQTKPQCQACVQAFDCQICYNNCTTSQTQMLTKCEYKFCDESGCRQTIQLNESQCFPTCCSRDANKFSIQQLNICESQSIKKIKTGIIISVCIGGTTFIIIASVFTYLFCKNRLRQCCCNCDCYFLKYYLCCRCLRRRTQIQSQIENMRSSEQIIINQHEQKNLSSQSWQQLEVPNQKISDSNNQCNICLSNNVDSVTKCGHYFHLECILEWFKLNPHCPLCKNEDTRDVQFYCRKCLIRKVKIDLKSVYSYNNVISSIKGPNCRACQ